MVRASFVIWSIDLSIGCTILGLSSSVCFTMATSAAVLLGTFVLISMRGSSGNELIEVTRGGSVPLRFIMTALPCTETVLSTPLGLPWMHISPTNAQLFILFCCNLISLGGVSGDGGVRFPCCSWNAADRQTEIEALLPKPAPIGIVERKV